MTPSKFMRALLVEHPGAAFSSVELATPVPGPGELLVRIIASGVNPLDLKIRAGAAAHAQHPLPAIIGIDLAGEIVAVGQDAGDFEPGDAVYGMAGGVGGIQGTLAQFAAVDHRLVARKPVGLSMREAAALPLSVITAWEGLVDRAEIAAGQRVLIHGGAGGVGHIAVQIAKAHRATVYATASAADFDLVRALGAEPLDYRTTSVEQYVQACTQGEGFDIVFDTIGGQTLDDSFRSVRRYSGHVISILGWGSHSLAPLSFRGATYSGVFTLLPMITGHGRANHGEILRQAAMLVDGGLLSPQIDAQRFTLDTALEAHQLLESGRASGKVVIDVA